MKRSAARVGPYAPPAAVVRKLREVASYLFHDEDRVSEPSVRVVRKGSRPPLPRLDDDEASKRIAEAARLAVLGTCRHAHAMGEDPRAALVAHLAADLATAFGLEDGRGAEALAEYTASILAGLASQDLASLAEDDVLAAGPPTSRGGERARLQAEIQRVDKELATSKSVLEDMKRKHKELKELLSRQLEEQARYVATRVKAGEGA